MKQRMTLTLDPVISHRAKLLARQRGVSLSSMVERFLAKETSPESGRSAFSARWKGRMRISDKQSESRHKKLIHKYRLGEESH